MTSSMIGPMIGTRTRYITSPAGSNAFSIPLATSTRILSSTPGAPSRTHTQDASRTAKANGSNADVTVTTATSERKRAGTVAARRRSTARRNGRIRATAATNMANGVAFVTNAAACPEAPSNSAALRLMGTARSRSAKVKNAICRPEALPTLIAASSLKEGPPSRPHSLLSRHPLDHVRREIDQRVVVLLQAIEDALPILGTAHAAIDLRHLLVGQHSFGNLRYRSVAHVAFLSAIVDVYCAVGTSTTGPTGSVG